MARLSGALAAVLVGVGLLAGPSQDGSAAAGDVQLALVGTFAAPTYVTAPPGDGTRLFVVEQAGRIRLMKNGGAPTLFLDIASLVRMEGERGLLSMAFAPDYGSSGRFYVYYTSNAVAGRALGDLVIAEYTVSADPDVANPSGRIVLSIPHPRGNHNGGQLQFGPDGYLYIGTGDGGGGGRSGPHGPEPRHAARQAPPHRPSRLGRRGVHECRRTIHSWARPVQRAEIWSYGLRNPWRFSFDRQTGDLTVADVGQNDWEEINFVPAAAGRGRGRELRLGLLGGAAHLQSERRPFGVQSASRAGRAGPRVLALTWLFDHGRLRRPRSDGASAGRPLRLRRLLHEPGVVDCLADTGRRGRHGHRPRPREHLFVRRGRLRSRLHRFRWRRGSAAPDRRCGATCGVRSFGASDAAPTASRWASSATGGSSTACG